MGDFCLLHRLLANFVGAFYSLHEGFAALPADSMEYKQSSNILRRRRTIIWVIALVIIIWLWASMPTGKDSAHLNQDIKKEYDAFPTDFPKKLWQARLGTGVMEDSWSKYTASWTEQNPDWDYQLLTG